MACKDRAARKPDSALCCFSLQLREQASTSEIPPCKRALRNIPVQTPPPKSQGPCVFPHPVSPPSCWPHAGGTADATPGIAHLSTRKQKNKRKVCPGTSNKQLEEHEEGIRGAELHTPMGESPHLSTMACGHHPGAWATSVLAHQAQVQALGSAGSLDRRPLLPPDRPQELCKQTCCPTCP